MKKLFFLLLLLGAAQLTRAQAPGSGGPAPTSDALPTDVPLDGGASLLLAGGLAYGLRNQRRRR